MMQTETTKEIESYSFSFVATIAPEKESTGAIRQFMPQGNYDNKRNLETV